MDPRRKRLLYLAQHRGSKEADLYIGSFAQASLAAMSDAECDAFEAIMEHFDVDLMDWLTGRKPVPPEVDTPMFRKIAAYDYAGARKG